MKDSGRSGDTIVDKTLVIREEVKVCGSCLQRYVATTAFCPFDGTKLELTSYQPPVDPLLGTTIDGRYEVTRLLGEGGMGTVYEVRHKLLARSFAIKLLRRDVACEPDLAARFINEAKATGSIKHPHIVSITDFGQLADATPFFVMELLVGQTLAQLIKASGPLEISRSQAILLQAVAALGAAHEAGVVHRDLKPENVFLARPPYGASAQLADDVKIVDFGAAKVLGASRITKTGIVFGTPHYMSPEQASGYPVDHRTDIYALGVIMYEMLTGRVPFEADTYMGVLTQHMFVQPRPPSAVRPDRAEQLGALEDITLRALEKKAENRYQSMRDLAADLEKAGLNGGDVTLKRLSRVRSPKGNDGHPIGNSPRVGIASASWLPGVLPGVRPPVSVRTAVLLGALFGFVVLGLLSLLRWPATRTAVVPAAGYAAVVTSASVRPADPLPWPSDGPSSGTLVKSPSVPDSSVVGRLTTSPTSVDFAGGTPPKPTDLVGGTPPKPTDLFGGTSPKPPGGHAPATDRPAARRPSVEGELADPWAK
jgi:eukaryotic-like serine/threonine-protein kinase